MILGFVVNGIVKANITTWERRFDLTSTQVGLIPSAYDIAAGVLAIPVSYLAIAGHKPRILSIMAFIMAMGSFIMVIPHFTVEPYTIKGSAVSDLCQGN